MHLHAQQRLVHAPRFRGTGVRISGFRDVGFRDLGFGVCVLWGMGECAVVVGLGSTGLGFRAEVRALEFRVEDSGFGRWGLRLGVRQLHLILPDGDKLFRLLKRF